MMAAPAMQAVQAVTVHPKVYITSFPKAGLHLVNLMVASVCEEFYAPKNWLGTFRHAGFSSEWTNVEHFGPAFEDFPNGRFLKGHTGYKPEIAEALRAGDMATLFVYRDLRDVAVSQMYHVLSEDDVRFKHKDKAHYRAMGSNEAVLKAIIAGDDRWPGLFERWALYAGWLDEEWVYSLSFEQMRYDTYRTADTFLRYVHGLAARALGYEMAGYDESELKQMALTIVRNTKRTDLSSTFRRGKRGVWKQHFTPDVKAVFKAHAGDWLERLGYEKDKDW